MQHGLQPQKPGGDIRQSYPDIADTHFKEKQKDGVTLTTASMLLGGHDHAVWEGLRHKAKNGYASMLWEGPHPRSVGGVMPLSVGGAVSGSAGEVTFHVVGGAVSKQCGRSHVP